METLAHNMCGIVILTLITTSAAWSYDYDTTPAPDGECEDHYSCATCSQVRVCYQTHTSLKEAFRLTCTGSNPYCDATTGTCTSVPSAECADTGKQTCLRDGVFPDLERCDEYHLCQSGVSKTFQCMDGEIFDGNMCTKGSDCHTFDCSNLSGAKVPHPKNPTVFAYCHHGKPLFVDRCPDHHKLHPESQKCYLEMKSSGVEEHTTPFISSTDVPLSSSTVEW